MTNLSGRQVRRALGLSSSLRRNRRSATPRSRMKSVNVELPDYAWTELKIRSAHQQASVRDIIMAALQKDGITINEIDMVEDGRRIRERDLFQ
jgi:hypothetical protein